ncbi:hypothetical protein [Burkholderia ubonensis]|uniref:hypothetical protein n=1 Tax=Burkholderia ubonensis TaxID=101571 RepID=UPI0012F903F9|nr:hypothetical protein [Burkholderia ubonensis]
MPPLVVGLSSMYYLSSLGIGNWQRFQHVTLPLISADIFAGALFSVLISLDKLGVSYFDQHGADTDRDRAARGGREDLWLAVNEPPVVCIQCSNLGVQVEQEIRRCSHTRRWNRRRSDA